MEPIQDDVLGDKKLAVAEIGAHSLQKHGIVRSYAGTYFRALKHQHKPLVYLDLFCGPGLAKLENTRKDTERYCSPAVRISNFGDPPHRCIFCDCEKKNIDSLSELLAIYRRKREREIEDGKELKPFPETVFFCGDANNTDILLKVEAAIPADAYCLCYLDPCKLQELHFETIRRLASTCKMDFIVLVASGMDGQRTIPICPEADAPVFDNFFGGTHWRERWNELLPNLKKGDREKFIVDEFDRAMRAIPPLHKKRYVQRHKEEIAVIMTNRKRTIIYQLVLYSRHDLAYKLWAAARKASSTQKPLL